MDAYSNFNSDEYFRTNKRHSHESGYTACVLFFISYESVRMSLLYKQVYFFIVRLAEIDIEKSINLMFEKRSL